MRWESCSIKRRRWGEWWKNSPVIIGKELVGKDGMVVVGVLLLNGCRKIGASAVTY